METRDINQHKEFKQLIQDVAEIKDALLGTPYIRKGLVSRVETLEKEIYKLNIIKWRVGAYAMGVSSIIYIAVFLLDKYV